MSTSDPLLGIADALYALPLAEFTPERDARAKELKSTDKELSTRVKALKKSSTAAWAVNQLVRHEAEQVAQLLAVGAALREAQQNLDGDELRALTRQRRQVTAAVTTRARSVCAELGSRLTDAVAEQVEATLTAAMVDPAAADAVRTGLLITALASTGVDTTDVGSAIAIPDALGFEPAPVQAAEPEPPSLHVVPDPEADQKARAAAEAALGEAEESLADAQTRSAEARAALAELEARGLELQGRQEELRRQLAAVETELDDLDDEQSEAEDAVADADESVATVTRDRDAARAALDALG